VSFDAIQAAFFFSTYKHRVSERVIQDVDLHLYVKRKHSLKHKKSKPTRKELRGGCDAVQTSLQRIADEKI
jgi:hypothetical protein